MSNNKFKEDVAFYLGLNKSKENIFDLFEGEEEDEENASKSTETAGGDDGDDGYTYSSKSTEEKASVASEFNKKVNEEPIKHNNQFLSGDITPEEKALLAFVRGNAMKDTTPEEDEMMRLVKSCINSRKKASVETLPGKFNEVKQNKGASEDSPDLKDDHTNGRNGSCQTESLFNY